MDTTYIKIDETHRLEIMESGNHYPQRWNEAAKMWGYAKVGNKQRHFKTESAARKFIASWVQEK